MGLALMTRAAASGDDVSTAAVSAMHSPRSEVDLRRTLAKEERETADRP